MLKAQWEEHEKHLPAGNPPAYFERGKNRWKLEALHEPENLSFTPCLMVELHVIEEFGDKRWIHGVLVVTAPSDLLTSERPTLAKLLRDNGCSGENVLWIERIAKAPWFLDGYAGSVPFKRGSPTPFLMNRSIDFARRFHIPTIALHAQGEDAKKAYKGWGMTPVGEDPYEPDAEKPERHYEVFAMPEACFDPYIEKFVLNRGGAK